MMIKIWLTEIPIYNFSAFLWLPSWKRLSWPCLLWFAPGSMFCLKNYTKSIRKYWFQGFRGWGVGVPIGSFYIHNGYFLWPVWLFWLLNRRFSQIWPFRKTLMLFKQFFVVQKIHSFDLPPRYTSYNNFEFFTSLTQTHHVWPPF